MNDPPRTRKRAAIDHGTWHGYKMHIRRDEKACAECKEAWRKYQLANRNKGTHMPRITI